jgi:hypothetical protein
MYSSPSLSAIISFIFNDIMELQVEIRCFHAVTLSYQHY